MSEANETVSGESNANLCSAPAGKGAANETDVQPTAGEMIAEWLLQLDADIAGWNVEDASIFYKLASLRAEGQRRRLQSILNAIHASTRS